MKLKYRLWVFTVYIGISGCGRVQPPLTPSDRMVYVDSKTMAPMVGRTTDRLPAMNNETGARTLMPGLYCPECKKWYPVPPPDQINRQPDAARCPITGTPLIADGPWPEDQ